MTKANPTPNSDEQAGEQAIPKPGKFDLEKFKSKKSPTIAGVETLLPALPHHSISQAKDFVKLHPDQLNYWSPELCFVNVPIKGDNRDQLHLIDEDIAMKYLPAGRIIRHRLALATKPFDIFFLAHVPSQNVDNPWNQTNLQACDQSCTGWLQATSRKQEGAEGYKIDFSRDPDAFPEPKWPTQTLSELILTTFAGRMIDREDHPALLRLIGAKPIMS